MVRWGPSATLRVRASRVGGSGGRRTSISFCLLVDHSAACGDRSSSRSRTSGWSTVVKNRQRGIASGYLRPRGGAGGEPASRPDRVAQRTMCETSGAPRMMGTHPAGMISSKAKTAPANAPDEMKCSPCHSRPLGAGATYTPRSLLRHHSAHSLASASSIASEGFHCRIRPPHECMVIRH
jgi:hypothetical protein